MTLHTLFSVLARSGSVCKGQKALPHTKKNPLPRQGISGIQLAVADMAPFP